MFLRQLLISAAIPLLGLANAQAQELERSDSLSSLSVTAGQKNIPLTLVVREGFPHQGLVVLIRRTRAPSRQVIVAVRRDAITPEVLAFAMDFIPNLVDETGAQGDAKHDVHLYEWRVPKHRRPAVQRAWLSSLVVDLRRATPKAVAGVGTAPTVTTFLAR